MWGFPHRCLDYSLSLSEASGSGAGCGPGREPSAFPSPTPCPGLAHRPGPEKSFPPRQKPGPSGASHNQSGKVSGSVSAGRRGRLLLRLRLPAERDVTLCAYTATLGFGPIPSLFVLQTPTYSLKLGSLKSQLPIGL